MASSSKIVVRKPDVGEAQAIHELIADFANQKLLLARTAEEIAEHLRDWDKENVHYDPLHYLALLLMSIDPQISNATRPTNGRPD